jgi:histidine triad (HIT) family protein
MKRCLVPILLLFPLLLSAQSEAYQKRKAEQLAGRSPFQDEIDGKYPDRIAYEDDLVLVLNSFAPQAPVHVLIIPRKRIPTINDLTDADSAVIARMFWAAKKIARERGIAETGYRLAINTNEDSGQSAFHIHMHLLGGMPTGPMVDQRWRNLGPSPGGTYRRALDSVRTAYANYHAAWLRADSAALLRLFTPDAVLMPPGMAPVTGLDAIRQHWFPADGSTTTIQRFDYTLDELKLDGNVAYVRGTSILSFTYAKDGQQTVKTDIPNNRLMVFERQDDGRWLITCNMWN